ncbi:MBL fold metallo-hydrolase [Roseimaritima sediminicola]|uniref:MBL fold metallo-hydrolase n=1 Tax=Roseimaritima sediminicola TaxID=2662066 RepID=UPI00129848FD|nr:MBL fold metallo-hydrolase [Roseimaritima sediminicola]
MTHFLCTACGTSYPQADDPPACCPICEDERQYVPEGGQSWTTLDQLVRRHANQWRVHEPGLWEVRSVPKVAIGQRAFLLRTPAGNILWDCIALLDEATKQIVHALGGIKAIAISHPHYYTTMQDWAAEFDAAVYLHARDRQWVMRPDRRLQFWDSDQKSLGEGLTLIRLGGHFPGGTVLHWDSGAEGQGLLLSGDIVQVAADRNQVSFLWSYPNMLPLAAGTVRRMAATLQPWTFERLYGAFAGKTIPQHAKRIVMRSAARYGELLDANQD